MTDIKPGISGTARIDYLQVALNYKTKGRLIEVLSGLNRRLRDEVRLDWTRPRHRGHEWDASGQSPLGVACAATHQDRGQYAGRLWISIPGTPLAGLHMREQVELVWYLRDMCEADVTRIDVTCDLPREWGTLASAEQALNDGNILGVRNTEVYKSRRGKEVATSLYFGSPGGNVRLVIYDKEKESKGLLPFDRWELRLADEKASAWCDTLLSAHGGDHQAQANYIGRTAIGWIKFIDRTSATRAARCKLLEWYDQLVNYMGKEFLPAVNRPIKTLARTLSWIKKQVAPTLVLLHRAIGQDKLALIFKESMEQVATVMSRERQAICRQWERERWSIYDNRFGPRGFVFQT